MAFPANWSNPITEPPGHFQGGVDPLSVLPSRPDLSQARLDIQTALLDAGQERHTPIQVTAAGVVWDGHHAVRAAAERGIAITVQVVSQPAVPVAQSIMDLPVG
jgi:hypothetical protein